MANLELLRKKTGNLQQAASVRPVTFTEGRARGMNGWIVRNGPMQFTVMADKCLDIAEFSYKGVNFSFLSKPGLTGRGHYDTNGEEALRSIMGGLLFTSGLENICPPCNDEGKEYPMHGRIRSTPAEHCCADVLMSDENLTMRISGEMREAELFGENMLLRRSLETEYGSKSFTLRDSITNLTFREEVMMILYHCNFGYPLLDEGTEVILPTRSVRVRDEYATLGLKDWNMMPGPTDNMPEQVFIHELAADQAGNTFAAIVNHSLGLGMRIDFNQTNLPEFFQWKSFASGDYVIGLEPANASVYGRLRQKEVGLHKLAPNQMEINELRFTVIEGDEEIQAVRAAAQALTKHTEVV